MDYLWAGMILIGIIYGALNGTIPQISEAALSSAKEGVTLCITTAGAMALWVGLMEVAKTSGIIQRATLRIQPLISWLFPNIPPGHPSREHITMNFIANFLGLNWGATPAGLKAMEALAELEESRTKKKPQIASDEMCTFLIINISSLQLIPINIIAYRSQYGSPDPTAVIGPGLVATMASTLAAMIFCKLMCRKKQ